MNERYQRCGHLPVDKCQTNAEIGGQYHNISLGILL